MLTLPGSCWQHCLCNTMSSWWTRRKFPSHRHSQQHCCSEPLMCLPHGSTCGALSALPPWKLGATRSERILDVCTAQVLSFFPSQYFIFCYNFLVLAPSLAPPPFLLPSLPPSLANLSFIISILVYVLQASTLMLSFCKLSSLLFLEFCRVYRNKSMISWSGWQPDYS